MIPVTNMLLSRSKVYLVGAGPGDPGLLTLKAKEVLEQADVVIYDYLANPLFLQYAPQAELINAGKRHRHHTIPQDQINNLLVEKAQEGKIVVRLKGGDPFIFGRGGEELLAVVQAGIPFEVIPGISSAIGGPTYAGISLTHRDFSSNVVFMTGTENPDKPKTMIPWDAIAQIGTIVVFMGLSTLKHVTQKLINAGIEPQRAVTVVQWATWPQQRSLTGTLETISELVEKHNFKAPALTIIGQVCQFSKDFNWFEKLPLFGQSILVTRAESGTSSLSESLSKLGAMVHACPTISIEPPQSWEAFDQLVSSSQPIDWVIFTSGHSIEQCMNRLRTLGKDTRIFGATKIACVGAATAQKLERYWLASDVVPEHFQSEGLLDALASYDLKGKHVWMPQAEESRNVLLNQLEAWGGIVHKTPVYRNVLPDVDVEPIVSQIDESRLDWLTFTSSSTVHNFFKLLPQATHTILQNKSLKVACIGNITAETAREYGLNVDLIPEKQNLPGLVEALIAACSVEQS